MRVDEITQPIPEESNPTFLIPFKNESGVATVPETLVWDLTAFDGTVIAIKQAVAVPAATSIITLTTAQTRFLEGEFDKAERLLTVHATYNSDYGVGLVARKQIKFTIEQFLMVGYPLNINIIEIILTDDYVQSVGVT